MPLSFKILSISLSDDDMFDEMPDKKIIDFFIMECNLDKAFFNFRESRYLILIIDRISRNISAKVTSDKTTNRGSPTVTSDCDVQKTLQ